MIGYLEGKASSQGPGSLLLLTSAGVGYQLQVPISLSFDLESDQVSLWVYTHVREDQITLFGFAKKHDRELFIRLLKVKGLGPKAALNVLSHLSPQQVQQCCERQDLEAFVAIPGIGKKTASQILLDLKGQFTGTTSLLPHSRESHSLTDEILQAAKSLGYPEKQAKSAIQKLSSEWNSETTHGQALTQFLRSQSS